MSATTLRRPGVVTAAVLAAGLASWAALTEPFSTGADAVTAVAIALGVALAASQWRAMTAPFPSVEGRAWWPWAVVLALVVAFELVSFFLGPRVEHPTISSLYDSATEHARAVKGLCFLAWLWLGAIVVRR